MSTSSAVEQKQEPEQKLSPSIIDNLAKIEEQIEQSSNFFKPKDGRTYILKINPTESIEQVQNDRFKTPDGRPQIRYRINVTHPNTSKTQIFETSKTLIQQIIEQLKQGFTVLKLTRTGSDRTTSYSIQGIE
jgi:hydroxymethylpyrimidine pyrophosphatase-like HAD family hydrolase